MADFKDFVQPNATLTPGIAGGLATAISLPLAINFDMSVKWIALLVSFLLGSVIVLSFKARMPVLLRTVYWVLNSLVIFATALGVGVNLDRPPAPPVAPPQVEKLLNSSEGHSRAPSSWFVASAFAESVGERRALAERERRGRSDTSSGAAERREGSREELEAVKRYLREQQEYQQKQQEYRKRWSF